MNQAGTLFIWLDMQGLMVRMGRTAMASTRRNCLQTKTSEERAACPKMCCVTLWKDLIEESARALFYMEDTTGYTFWDGDRPSVRGQVFISVSKLEASRYRDRARKIVRSKYGNDDEQ